MTPNFTVSAAGGAAPAEGFHPATSVRAADPIFEAIERHREAAWAFEAADRLTDRVATTDEVRAIAEADDNSLSEATYAEGYALGTVLHLAPTTLLGTRAVLRYVAVLEDGIHLPERVASLLKSPAPAF
jgi:hypothetical protein